jgi:chromosomal replication initiator protein
VAPLHHIELDQFVSRLQAVVGPQRWQVWFEGSTDFHLADEGLTVGVANLFLSDYLKTRFADRLAQTVYETFGRQMPVHFRVQPDLFQKRRAENIKGEIEAMEKLGQADPRPAPPPAQATNAARAGLATHAALPALAPLRPLFTLDGFIVGPCNAMAYAAAQSAGANPGKDFHPLFIHGSCGLGKTHLLQGILYALRKRGDLRVACLSAEQFTNRYLSGMRSGRLDAFRHRYRNLDVLAIDDIHFLAGKPATQEEFLHTFNEFDGGRRLIILASDSPPREIDAVQDRLISRWVSGLVVRLSEPDLATRRRILEAKARLIGRILPEEVLALVATRVSGSVRELEGALVRITAYAALLKQPLTVDLARQALADFATVVRRRVGLEEIVEPAAEFFGVTRADIHSHRKSHPVSMARQVTMVLARELTDLSFADIARGLGGKNHTTVLAACHKWQAMVKSGAEVHWTSGAERRTMLAERLLAYLKERIRR